MKTFWIKFKTHKLEEMTDLDFERLTFQSEVTRFKYFCIIKYYFFLFDLFWILNTQNKKYNDSSRYATVLGGGFKDFVTKVLRPL